MPYLPDKRQYRSFEGTFEADAGAPDSYIVEGYATTFDVPYDFGHDGIRECVLRSAIDGADMSDVIFQVNHQGTPLARLRNGTLTIEPDSHGLHVRADLSGSQDARNTYEAIKNGLIDRMSWGFVMKDEDWDYDHETRTSTIKRIRKVFDVSAVSRPADDDTEIHARSYLDGVIEAEQRQEMAQREQSEELRNLASILRITR